MTEIPNIVITEENNIENLGELEEFFGDGFDISNDKHFNYASNLYQIFSNRDKSFKAQYNSLLTLIEKRLNINVKGIEEPKVDNVTLQNVKTNDNSSLPGQVHIFLDEYNKSVDDQKKDLEEYKKEILNIVNQDSPLTFDNIIESNVPDPKTKIKTYLFLLENDHKIDYKLLISLYSCIKKIIGYYTGGLDSDYYKILTDFFYICKKEKLDDPFIEEAEKIVEAKKLNNRVASVR